MVISHWSGRAVSGVTFLFTIMRFFILKTKLDGASVGFPQGYVFGHSLFVMVRVLWNGLLDHSCTS